MEQLEERIVLDAAPADAGNGDNPDDHQDATRESSGDTAPEAQQAGDDASAQGPAESSDPLGDVLNQDLNVVLISNALDQVEVLAEAAVADAKVIVYDADQDNLGDIVDALEDLVDSTGQEIGQIAIISHGAEGVLSLGDGELWTVETLQADSSEWTELGGLLADDAVIDLYGCNIGQGEEGLLFIQELASVTDSTVRASDDATGNVDGSDWDFEVIAGAADNSALLDYSELEPGTIRLADLEGTAGNDDLTIESTDSFGDVRGLGGDDTITWNGGTVTGTINGGADNDTLYLNVADGVTDITYDGTPSSGTLTYDGATITWSDFENVYLKANSENNDITVKSGSSVNRIDGGEGDDTLTVDFSAGGLTDDLVYDGGSESNTSNGDTLVLSEGSFTDVTYTFTSANDGTIELEGLLIAYYDLEPITSDITATNVTLNYSDAAETITITDAGSGQTTVDSTSGELVTFDNPTDSLTINAGGGSNTINLESLAGTYSADVTINGGDAGATITVSTGVDITAGGGTIAIYGGLSSDEVTVEAGSTIDYIYGDGAADTITNYGAIVGDINGAGGSDTIVNKSGAVVGNDILGKAGADKITNRGTVGNDIDGGAGKDTITNRGYVGDSIEGGTGNDSITNSGTVDYVIFGGDDDDVITNSGSITLGITGEDGDDTITNTAAGYIGEDLRGEAGADSITNKGAVGNDIDGGDGADSITNRGYVDDDINGGRKSDTITNTGTVNDDIHGNRGADVIINTGTVSEDVEGGRGADSITNEGTVAYVIDGGAGADTITNRGYVGDYIDGWTGNDSITNSGTVDYVIFGGQDDDVITNSGAVLEGITGEGGDDTITNDGFVGVGIDGDVGDDGISNSGTVGDFIDGWKGEDTIVNSGTVGFVIYGGDDNDLITNSGSVTVGITGEDGDDTITNAAAGYIGEDLRGGDGADSITNRGYVDDDINGGQAGDTITNTGTVGDDIHGNRGADVIINTGTVHEDVEGGRGADSITNRGTVARNIDGGEGADSITNSSGGLVYNILGGNGNNTLKNFGLVEHNIEGGDDRDTITNSGTVGSDIYAYDERDIVILGYGGKVGGIMDGGDPTVYPGDTLYIYVSSYTYFRNETSSGSLVDQDGDTIRWRNFEALNIIPYPGNDSFAAGNSLSYVIDDVRERSSEGFFGTTSSSALPGFRFNLEADWTWWRNFFDEIRDSEWGSKEKGRANSESELGIPRTTGEFVNRHLPKERVLNLEEFLEQLKKGLHEGDILVFDADEIHLALEQVWLAGLRHGDYRSAVDASDNEQGPDKGQAPAGLTLVFNLDDIRVADMFRPETGDYCLPGVSGPVRQPDRGVSMVFNLDEMNLVDAMG